MINTSNIYKVFTIDPQKDGTIHRQYVGKYLLHDNQLEILEDHDGILGNSLHEGAVTDQTRRTLDSLKRSPYLDVVSQYELDSGKRPEFYEEADLGEPAPTPEAERLASDQKVLSSDGSPNKAPVHNKPPPFPTGPAVFYYYREGVDEPDVLEVNGTHAWMNGEELEHGEIATILQNVQAGVAVLRYKHHVDNQAARLRKMEALLKHEDLAKALDVHLESALRELREASKKGHIAPEHLKTLTGHIFQDDMIGGMGNKKAYKDFLSRPKAGVHVRMDANDFGQINKIHGFETGNDAIRALGHGIRAALHETVGHKKGKSFRIGGDEFHVHVPTYEDAAEFARAARKHLEAVPPIGGSHGLSMSVGFGHTPEHAEQALIQAKTAKKQQNYPLGAAKTHVHSLVPGKEGPVPTDSAPAPLTPTAPVTQPESSPAPKIHLT